MKFEDKAIVLNTLLNMRYSSEDELGAEVREWAEDNVFDNYGLYAYSKRAGEGRIICSSCLHQFNPAYHGPMLDEHGLMHATCPHCGKRLHVESTRKTSISQYGVFRLTVEIDGVQCIRIFEGHRRRSINQRDPTTGVIAEKYRHTQWFEVVRIWDNSKSQVKATRNIGMFAYNRTSPWGTDEIRVCRRSGAFSRKEDFALHYLAIAHECPVRVKAISLNASYLCSTIGVLYSELKHKAKKEQIVRFVSEHPMFETMIKAGYTAFACVLANKNTDWEFKVVQRQYSDRSMLHSTKNVTMEHAFVAVRICIRNSYPITDPVMYFDYLNELETLGKDFHNAHYVCPQSLVEAHALTIGAINRLRRRIQARVDALDAHRRIEEARSHDEQYRREKEAYLGIRFSDELTGYEFHVIPSASALAEEGEAMHHCVGSYWRYRDSLIISCRRADGKRHATIEVDLRDFTIAQTRAHCNAVPEHREEIDACVICHMDEIRKAREVQAALDRARAEAETATPCMHALMAI